MSSTPDKKILIVTSLSDRPESEIFVHLKQEKVDLRIFCDPDAPEIERYKSAGISVIPVDLSNASPTHTKKLIRDYVVKNSIDTVYAPRTFTLQASIRALSGIRAKLIAYRGTTGHLGIFDFGPRRANTHPRVNKIICVSDAVRDYLLGIGIDQNKLITIRKGHDVDWYHPAPRKELELLGVPDNAFVVGFSGRVRRVKGVQYLIKALSELPNHDTEIHLLIVGEMADRSVKRLIKRPKYKSRIHCTGFRNDASALIGACDAFVMPSLKREGLPKALVEAMAQGVPCIGSIAGGIPEIIVHNESGLLVPPHNSRAIAEAIHLLASDRNKAQQLGIAGKSRVKEVFNIHNTAAQMKKLFLED